MRLALYAVIAACGSNAAALDAPQAPIDAAVETHALSMNDVSILLPLPGDVGKPVLLTLAGFDMPLIQSNLFVALITASDIGPKTPSPMGIADFQVVALRFDLCDRSAAGVCPTGVDGRLRLILQPLYTSGGATLGNDVAIHAFFPIPAADLPGVVNELRALARIQDAPAEAPLEVSPALVAGNAEYLARLKALVARYVAAERLVRVTRIGQEKDSGAFAWLFGGYDRIGEDYAAMAIPGVHEVGQKAQLTGGDTIFNIDPIVDDPPGFALAVNGELFATATADARLAAVEALTVIQNPLVHTADDLQCVTCHVSTNLLALRTGEVGVDPMTLAGRFVTPYNTSVTSIEGTDARVIRGFGWAASSPAISQRVANDTAEVLTEIEQRYPVR